MSPDHVVYVVWVGESVREQMLFMLIYSLAHLLVRKGLPSLRQNLLLGVGPVIRVVEVEQEVHTSILDSASHLQGVLQVAIAITLRVAKLRTGIYKEAQTDIVKAIITQNLKGITLNATVRELCAVILL